MKYTAPEMKIVMFDTDKVIVASVEDESTTTTFSIDEDKFIGGETD